MRVIALVVVGLLGWSQAAPVHASRFEPPPPVRLQSAPEIPLKVWTHLRVLRNSAGLDLTPVDAAALIAAEGPDVLRPVRPEQALGRRVTAVWAELRVHNDDVQPMTLVLAQRYPTIEHLSLHIEDDAGRWQPWAGAHETAQRAFERDRYASFTLDLAPGQTRHLLLAMRTHAPLRWNLALQAPQAYAVAQRRLDWALSFGYTIPLAVLLLLLGLSRLGRLPGQGLFIGLVLADLVATTWITGFGSELLPAASGEQLRTVGHLAYAAMLFFGPRHALVAGGGRAYPELLRRAAHAVSFGGAGILMLALWLAPLSAGPLTGVLGLAMALLCAVMAWNAHRRGMPSALAYLAVWLAYVGTTLLYFLVVLEVWSLEMLPALVFAQTLGITLLLGQTIARAAVDRDARLQEALAAAEAQRRRAAELAEERERLFAAASHDLRQPLQALAINAELLAQRFDQRTEVAADDRRLVGRMQEALAGTNELLESLLDLRAQEVTGAASETAALLLSELMQRVARPFRTAARQRGLMLRIAPSRAWVQADALRLERVLRNLVANALRYTDAGWVLVGVRRIGVDSESAQVVLQVIDTGVGIDPARAEALFGEHVRGDGTIAGSGHGLGLYIVRRLCAAMGVPVRVRPRRADDWRLGTVFEVHLPAVPPPPHEQATTVAVASVPALRDDLLAGCKVLLVDDDAAVRDALSRGLAALGAEVDARAELAPGPAAVAAWAGCQAVVCDHDLGAEHTGLELLVTAPLTLQRVLISGHATGAMRARARHLGITLLVKPVPLTGLALALSTPPRRPE